MLDRSIEDLLKKEVEELRTQLQASLHELQSGKETFQQMSSVLQLEVEKNRDLWEQLLQATQSLQHKRSRSRGQMLLYQKERLHLFQASLQKVQLQQQLESTQENLDEPEVVTYRQLQDHYDREAQNVRQRNTRLEKNLEMQIELHACEVLRYEEMEARLRSELEDLKRVLVWELACAAHREARLLQELTQQQKRLHCQDEQQTAGPRVPAVGGASEGHERRPSHLRSVLRLAAGAVVGLVALTLINEPAM